MSWGRIEEGDSRFFREYDTGRAFQVERDVDMGSLLLMVRMAEGELFVLEVNPLWVDLHRRLTPDLPSHISETFASGLKFFQTGPSGRTFEWGNRHAICQRLRMLQTYYFIRASTRYQSTKSRIDSNIILILSLSVVLNNVPERESRLVAAGHVLMRPYIS